MTKLYRTSAGIVAQEAGQPRGRLLSRLAWDDLFTAADAAGLVRSALAGAPEAAIPADRVLPPLVSQEVWAAGVTYFRSRDARMEESSAAGGGDFYAKVYNADRPELFFKATASRTVGHGDSVRIRADATWNVPEPELTLAINAQGKIFGYTIGNDMSSRDIEGANPLYLPQAKVYDRCCALGPAILLSDKPLEASTPIELEVRRGDAVAFAGKTELANLKR
ncbi:MAG: fumarylacetoacetate hydrolase family protein, partial [Planctomycetota bacterium]|nr:fumarylacetoacetate hydrolase family protein [Planctomycetota bacterium]